MKVLKFTWRVIVFLLYVLKHFGIEPFLAAWADAKNQVPLATIKSNHQKRV